MLKPLLIIGVGGSGGKTIRAMKETISQKLLFKGYKGGIPTAWQFLQIDTTYDGQDFNARMLPKDEVCLVVPSGATFGSILNSLTNRASSVEDVQEMLTGWGIPESSLSVGDGAGMIRGIGRQVGIADSKKIQGALNSAVSKMLSPSATSELLNIAQFLKVDPKTLDKNPSVILVTSLSGGSGAGMFMDVAEILKRSYRDQAWAQNIISFLYTAEVFEGITGAGDVRQNCLGAINEIVAGRYRQPTKRTNRLMEKLEHNAPNPDIHFIGSQGNILIGSRNAAGVNLAQDKSGVGMNEVFTTIGEMLAGIFTDSAISDWVYKTAFVNAVLGTKIKDESGLTSNEPSTVLPFASMGFARLSLGIDRVSRYITDALIRAQVDLLLFPENLTPEQLSDQTKEQFLDAKVEFAWDGFLAKSKLNERKEKNDVIDSLVVKEVLNRRVADLTTTTFASFDGYSKPEKIDRVAARLWNDFEVARDEFQVQVRTDQNKKASEWANAIQVSLLDYVADYVARNGILFAVQLLTKLSRELKDVAQRDLKSEIDALNTKLSRVTKESWASRVQDCANGRQGLSRDDRDVKVKLEEYVSNVSRGIEEIYRKKLASDLMIEFADDFVDVLCKRLLGERELLLARAAAKKPEDNDGLVLNSLPSIGSGNPVPKGYLPRAIEKILIEPEKFLEFYLKYAKADILDPIDKANAFETSVRDALLRVPLTKDAMSDHQTFISSVARWVPRTLDSVVNRRVEFSLTTDFWDLKEANEKWLALEGSQFQKVRNMSIAKYCKPDDPVEQKEREEAFIKAYSEMLRISVPLVKFNERALKSIQSPSGESPTVTQKKSAPIPFDVNSQVGTSLVGVLSNDLGVNISLPSFAKEWFDPSSELTEMFVIQVPSGALPAYAFASLTNPIAESVLAAKNSPILWSSYWTNRRSRPLQEAVPVSDKMLRSMITGWFVAKSLGLVTDAGEGIEKTLKIANPTLTPAGFSMFPSPLLVTSVEDVRNKFALPSLLSSIGLAMVNYGQTGDESQLHAYRLLKYLGREVTVEMKLDDWDNGGLGDLSPGGIPITSSVVRDWVFTGQIKGLTGSQLSTEASLLAESTSESRAEFIKNYVDSQNAKFNKYWDNNQFTSWSKLPNLWEIKDEISEALQNISHYVTTISDESQPDLDG